MWMILVSIDFLSITITIRLHLKTPWDAVGKTEAECCECLFMRQFYYAQQKYTTTQKKEYVQ